MLVYESQDAIVSSLSQWRLVHKDSTYFGPYLWLNAVLDKPLPVSTSDPSLPTTAEEHLTFEPSVLAMFPPPPSPPPEEGEQLTNENLLKSIGFLPGSTHFSFSPEEPAFGHEDDKIPPLCSSSTDQLVKTFEMIDNPSYSAGDEPHPPNDGGVANDDDDDGFVVIVPDCFKLDKPLPGFTPPPSSESFCDLEDAFVVDPSTTSCDSHVSISMPVTSSVTSTASQTGLPCDEGGVTASAPDQVVLATPSGDGELLQSSSSGALTDDSTQEEKTLAQGVDSATSTSSPLTHKNPHRSRFSLRNLKKNPLAVATGFVDAVSGFVNDKVHFVPAVTKPCIQFASDQDSESSDDEEFLVSSLERDPRNVAKTVDLCNYPCYE